MAATVQLVRLTGAAPGTETDVTNDDTVASNADDATPDVSDFIPKPGGGLEEYSRWVTFRHKVTVTPNGMIDNLRVFTTANPWDGLGAVLVGRDASTGANAGYRAASSDLELTTGNHTGLDGAPEDVSTLTAAAPRALGGSITNPSTGAFGDHYVVQVQVDDTITAQTLPVYVLTFRRDET